MLEAVLPSKVELIIWTSERNPATAPPQVAKLLEKLQSIKEAKELTIVNAPPHAYWSIDASLLELLWKREWENEADEFLKVMVPADRNL